MAEKHEALSVGAEVWWTGRGYREGVILSERATGGVPEARVRPTDGGERKLWIEKSKLHALDDEVPRDPETAEQWWLDTIAQGAPYGGTVEDVIEMGRDVSDKLLIGEARARIEALVEEGTVRVPLQLATGSKRTGLTSRSLIQLKLNMPALRRFRDCINEKDVEGIQSVGRREIGIHTAVTLVGVRIIASTKRWIRENRAQYPSRPKWIEREARRAWQRTRFPPLVIFNVQTVFGFPNCDLILEVAYRDQGIKDKWLRDLSADELIEDSLTGTLDFDLSRSGYRFSDDLERALIDIDLGDRKSRSADPEKTSTIADAE